MRELAQARPRLILGLAHFVTGLRYVTCGGAGAIPAEPAWHVRVLVATLKPRKYQLFLLTRHPGALAAQVVLFETRQTLVPWFGHGCIAFLSSLPTRAKPSRRQVVYDCVA
jgi:hypothetical protein